MLGLAIGALATGAAVGAGWIASTRAQRRLALPFAPDELHWAVTRDGWELPLGRYLPRGERAAKEPVILCHGLGANRFNLDLDERYSLARSLAANGFETFVVELRGTGLARRRGGSRYAFVFDDYVEEDVPALIAKAKAVSGGERVFWVGHSKGGIVMYAYCGLRPRDDVAGVVAIGSPMSFTHHPPERRRVLVALRHVLLFDGFYVEKVVKTLAPVGPRFPFRVRFMAAQENIDPEVVARAMANLLGNVSSGVLRQFAKWLDSGRFTSWDGSIDYAAGLARSPVPFLLMAGGIDLMAPTESLESARAAMVDANAAGQVELVHCSIANGFRCDYGHGDLVLGRHAPDEIFPRIARWLRSRATPVPA